MPINKTDPVKLSDPLKETVRRAYPSRNWTYGLTAFALYAFIALVFFGRSVLRHPQELYIGCAHPDHSLFMWMLVWWPYAITHRINPFITKLIWVPGGCNLVWTHLMLAPSIVIWPLTRLYGPVFSWNILCLSALALNGWGAFLLCRYQCHSFWPAFVGGYLFGFSPYVLGHLLGHLALIIVFPIPLAVYLVLLRFDGRISAAAFIALLAAVALFQFLCSQEIFATAVVLGSLIMVLTAAIGPGESRSKLTRLSLLTACGLAAAALMSAPLWYEAITADYQAVPINTPQSFSSDLLGFIIPNSLVVAGRMAFVSSYSEHVGKSLAESNAYLGIPLILVVFAFVAENYKRRSAMVVVLALVVIAVLSLGPRLHVAGTDVTWLPWWFATRLPLINQALPVRLCVYLFLAAAVIVSMWLATPGYRVGRWILVAVGVGSLVPNLGFPIWSTPVDTPAFFSNGTYRRYIARNETVLILPYGTRGNSMLWQAETDMYFKLAGGSSPYTPEEYKYWPILPSLFGDGAAPNFKDQLEGFVEAHGVNVIIAAPRAREVEMPYDYFPPPLRRDAVRFFAPLGVAPVETDGVLLWRLPTYHNLTFDAQGRPAGIGAKVFVNSVRQSGTTITVDGEGFSLLTVINFFNKPGPGPAVNLGGFRAGGWVKIPIQSVRQNQLTFTVPAGAKPGISYVQALNPPYTSSSSSGNEPGGSFVLH